MSIDSNEAALSQIGRYLNFTAAKYLTMYSLSIKTSAIRSHSGGYLSSLSRYTKIYNGPPEMLLSLVEVILL